MRIGLQGCARSCSPILYNDGSGPPNKPDVVIGKVAPARNLTLFSAYQ
jgi:hypothetical protein